MEKEDERGPQSPELENNATSNVFFITKKRVPEELKAKNTKNLNILRKIVALRMTMMMRKQKKALN